MARTDRLLHPGFVGAVTVLIFNDHVLKGRWPAPVTGKLSDLAGVFVVAVVAGTLAARPPVPARADPSPGLVGGLVAGPGRDPGPDPIGGPAAGPSPAPDPDRRLLVVLAVVAAAFVALKSSPTVAALAAPALGGPTRTDPGDLVALVALAPAYRFLTRSGPWRQHRAGPAPSVPIARTVNRARASGRAWRLAGVVAVGSLTTYGVTATSCLEAESVNGFAVTGDDGLVAVVSPGSGLPDPDDAYRAAYRSTDGGVTWTPLAPGATWPALERPSDTCLDDGRCFRVADRRRVETRTGSGSWATAFEFSDEQVERMRLREDACSGAGDVEGLFAFLTVAPTTVPPAADDPGTVVVSMGSQGVLRLDPATGSWTRHAVGSAEPVSIQGPTWFRYLSLAPLGLAVLSPAIYLLRRRSVSRRRRLVAAASCFTAAAVTGAFTLITFVGSLGGVDYAGLGVAAAGFSLVALLVSLGSVLLAPVPASTPGAGNSPVR